MTEDRELRREAIVELVGILRALRLRAEAGDQLAEIVYELADWIHRHNTD